MMNILVVKTAALGDVLRTTVILEGLMEKYVNLRIHWLTSKSAESLLDNNPFIEKLYFKEEPWHEFLNNNYDLIISLEEDVELLKLLNKVKKKTLFGVYLDKEGKIRYTPHSAMWYDMSLISKFGKQVADELKKSNMFSYPELLYKMLGLEWKHQRYRVFLTIKDIKYAKALKHNLSPDKPIIGIVTGSGGRWPMKVLSIDKQIELIKKIRNQVRNSANIMLLSGYSSLELNNVNEIKKKCPYVTTHDVQDIDEFIGIVNLCDMLITPDTLSMHIGIALNKYVITYFTVTSAAEIEAYTGQKMIARHPDFCSYVKDLKPRPNITDSIDLDEIIDSLAKLLNKGNN